MQKQEYSVLYDLYNLLKRLWWTETNDFRKRMNNHKSDLRGTPTKDTIPVNRHIHYCQLNTHQTFKDPYFHVIPFLTVKDLEIYCMRKFNTALNEKDSP